MAFLVSGSESGKLIRLIAVTSPNLIPRPDEYNNIAQTLKGNGCYAGPIGEGERAVVAAVHPISFRAVFESLQKLPATRDRPMVHSRGGPVVDLNTLIPANSGLELVAADNINERERLSSLEYPEDPPAVSVFSGGEPSRFRIVSAASQRKAHPLQQVDES